MSKFAKKETSTAKVAKNLRDIDDADEGKLPGFVKAQKEKAASKLKVVPNAAKKEKVAPSEDTRKITLINKTNPKREGSAAYDRYELYKANKTVAAFYAAGGSSADLRYDEKAGHIKVG